MIDYHFVIIFCYEHIRQGKIEIRIPLVAQCTGTYKLRQRLIE